MTQTALVTGAGSGLGREIAHRLAADGMAIVVNDIDPSSATRTAGELRAAGCSAVEAPFDVADEQGVDAMVEAAVDACGQVDVLVNNAGVADRMTPTTDQDVADWQRIIDIDLRGTYLCCRRVGREMLARGSGRVVNLASIVGLSGFPMRTAYGPAKAGVINLTKALAVEWAGRGVNVNAVAPGYIRTPLVDDLLRSGKVDEQKVRRRIPLGDLGRPGHIAAAVAFLVSDEASYITGVTLPVDGGWLAAGNA